MKRRRFLSGIAVAAFATAGCLDGGPTRSTTAPPETTGRQTETSTATTTEEPASTPTSAPARTPNDDGTAAVGEVHHYLEDSGEDFAVDVRYIAATNDALRLKYVSTAGESTKYGDTEANERAFVASAYGVWAEENGKPLEATVVDAFGDPRYHYRVDPEWTAAVRNDQATMQDLREKITESVESE